MSLGSMWLADLGELCLPMVAVHHYGHVLSLLIHVGCMWMINIHQGPMIAEAHSSQCVLGCGVSWWMAPFLGSSLLSHVNRPSKINDCFLNVLNHFPQHMFCCCGLKALPNTCFCTTPCRAGSAISANSDLRLSIIGNSAITCFKFDRMAVECSRLTPL